MTKQMKLAKEWEHGEYKNHKLGDEEIEFDVNSGLNSMPRVIFLRNLGYRIETWEAYAQAEINELGSSIRKAA